jgi:hypothetical protein
MVSIHPHLAQLRQLSETVARGRAAEAARDELVASAIRYGHVSVADVVAATGLQKPVVADLVRARYADFDYEQVNDAS